MILPASASLLPAPRIDAALVGGAGHSPIARDSDGPPAEGRQAPAGGGSEVLHVFATGFYLAVDDPHPGRCLLPIMGPASLLLPFGISVPQLGREHLATLRAGTPACVVDTPPMRFGAHPPIPQGHGPSPRRIEFPDFAIDIVRRHRQLRVKTRPWRDIDPSSLATLAGHLHPGLSDLTSRTDVLTSALFDENATGVEGGVRALIGAGPGSTPSGDDALSGIALALRSAGRIPQLDLLSRTVESIDLAQATPALSAALIRAAVSGHCVPEIAMAIGVAHRLVTTAANRSATAETPPAEYAAVLSSLDRIGHSSGHDLFTGFLAALTALACSRPSWPGPSPSLPPPRPPSTAATTHEYRPAL